MPSVRSASEARPSTACAIASRRAGVSARVSLPTRSSVQRASRTSGAPFENTTSRSSSSTSEWAVLMSLRSDENGTSPTRGNRRSSAPAA